MRAGLGAGPGRARGGAGGTRGTVADSGVFAIGAARPAAGQLPASRTWRAGSRRCERWGTSESTDCFMFKGSISFWESRWSSKSALQLRSKERGPVLGG